MGIGETLCQDLDRLVMRAAGKQEKTECGNIQLCAGLKARIEGAIHAVGQRQRERAVQQRSGDDLGDNTVAEEE